MKRIAVFLVSVALLVSAFSVSSPPAFADAMTITSVQPSPVIPGQTMTLFGAGFVPGMTTVVFDTGLVSRSPDFVSVTNNGTQASFVAPYLAQGQHSLWTVSGTAISAPVTVTFGLAGQGQQPCSPAPCYPTTQGQVVITSFSATAAPGTLTTVYGLGFTSGSTITVGQATVTATSVTGTTQLQFVVPNLPAGLYQMTITSSGVTSPPVAFTVLAGAGGSYNPSTACGAACGQVVTPWAATLAINGVVLYGNALVVAGGPFASPTISISTMDGKAVVTNITGQVQSAGEATFVLSMIPPPGNYVITISDSGLSEMIYAYI